MEVTRFSCDSQPLTIDCIKERVIAVWRAKTGIKPVVDMCSYTSGTMKHAGSWWVRSVVLGHRRQSK